MLFRLTTAKRGLVTAREKVSVLVVAVDNAIISAAVGALSTVALRKDEVG